MNTIRRISGAALGLGMVASLAAAPLAQAQTIPAPLAAKEAETLDPEALAALDRMGSELRSLDRFTVLSDGMIEGVYANGQKLHAPVRTTYQVDLPGQMTVEMQSDKSHTRLIYDGEAITLVGLKALKYVRFPVTGTVAEVFERAEDDFGLSLPLREMFLWGSELSDAETPRTGFKVGESVVSGVAVDHYAFRQSTVDWQIWLEKGEKPLPRKLVITRTDLPQQPQFTAEFTWNTSPTLTPGTFEWTPTSEYELVDFGTAALTNPARSRTKR